MRLSVSDYAVKRVASYIVEQHKRFLNGASDSGLGVENIQTQTQSSFNQLTGICLVFVDFSSITEYVGDCQRQLWDLTNEYFGYFGKGE